MQPLDEQDLLQPVFPSEEKTVLVLAKDEYGGAHHYLIQKCKGFNNGQTEYVDEYQYIDFVKKLHDGTVIAGLQNEQIYIMLIDRVTKLNSVYPCEENEQMIGYLQALLDLCKQRVQSRIDRGIMGDLKK